MTGKHWSIQTADWRDYSRLNQLEKLCFRKEDLWPFISLIGVLILPGVVRLKALRTDVMVGFIAGEQRNGTGWITTVCVHPDHRRDGIAAALLDACEKMLKTPSVRLSVRISNQAAIALYEKTGYTMINRWKRYYAGGEDALVFEKRI